MFVDRVQIEVIAGKGGDGCCSFRRERFIPKGGPDGGDGGNGGSVIIKAREGVDHLSQVAHRKMWKAEHGRNGEGSNRHGRRGADLLIEVPPGTIVIDATRGFTIKDLTEIGDQVIAARSGKGGRGNVHFKSSTNRGPTEFSRGEQGEKRILILELKSIADVGLVGKPNAGKSTLLSRLSRARPEIADYPFTTKHPNLGQVRVDFERSFVMADIPGLIEGAHTGIGLGHEFLRHIQRSGVLVHLVEPSPVDGSDPIENYHAIRAELARFDSELGERPEIVAITKAELPTAREVQQSLGEAIGSRPLFISAVTGQGLNELVNAICSQLVAASTE